ncbi:class I SAM-dependent methyltransferase [Neisseriaceae bacterium TC5R-5]|nr:class I SAM-dependent methyltransferase [Neisseriaceae bacterium TC5R-5]
MLSNPVASFSLYSDLYACYRPDYPEALYQWLLPLCPGTERVWDCATGNGQAALRLAKDFARVDATDISSAQLAQAERHSQVFYRECPAEVTPFDDESFDLITVSQALHWFHFPSFWPEMVRVLKPAGIFAAWGYHAFSVNPQVDKEAEVFNAIIEPFWSSRNRILWSDFSSAGCPLATLPTPKFTLHNDWSLPQFLGYLDTLSASQMCKQTLGDLVLHEASQRIGRAWGHESTIRQVSMPLSLLVARKPGKDASRVFA